MYSQKIETQQGKMVIEDVFNDDGEQDIDGITFENYHGHFITYDYCPQIGMHWEVSEPETAPIYPVCMQTCCDVFEVTSTMNDRFGPDVVVDDELHYAGEFNNRATYRSFKHPGNGLFYDETFKGWAYILGQVTPVIKNAALLPYAGYRTTSTCPPEKEQHWTDGYHIDHGDYVIVKSGF